MVPLEIFIIIGCYVNMCCDWLCRLFNEKVNPLENFMDFSCLEKIQESPGSTLYKAKNEKCLLGVLMLSAKPCKYLKKGYFLWPKGLVFMKEQVQIMLKKFILLKKISKNISYENSTQIYHKKEKRNCHTVTM